ncbi:MAG: acetyl-CoA hydrolase/transferase C-terminal domain-containing protein [Dehalococcoidia bacterium]
MDWREEYAKKTASAEEAARTVRPGDVVMVTRHPPPRVLMDALAARKEELRDVRIRGVAPAYDPGWFQPGWGESFFVTAEVFLGPVARPALDERRADYYPTIFSHQLKSFDERGGDQEGFDILLLVVSPPDRNGFCSFGANLWGKRAMARRSRKVIAQVDENAIRTYGTNYIHVSEIDCFVEHTPPKLGPEEAQALIGKAVNSEARAELERLLSDLSPQRQAEVLPLLVNRPADQIREFARARGLIEPSEEVRRVGEYVAELVRDGDTIQLGIGTPSGYLPNLGVFDDKKDLGWHSEMGARGVIRLVQRGVINGSRKTINTGIAVFTGLDGCDADEVAYCAENPLIELRDADYVVNIRTVAAHDNMVSINNALSVDLSGQINSETVFGARLWNGTGGQPELHIGAVLSKGGRALTLLRSTAIGGTVSRIVAQHEEGSVITIPRTFADIIVTEYGVARLLGKSIRERARELIAIAHPDFRADLNKAAQKLYYP